MRELFLLKKSRLNYALIIGVTLVFFVRDLSGQQVQFSNISLKDGLSQNTVTALLQDDDDFIWIGTNDGLNRYDGRNFLVFRGDKGEKDSLSGNTITALYQDREGLIWVGTNFGLNRVDPNSFKIKSYTQWFEDSLSLSSNAIRCITEDAEGNLWVGTTNGLNRMEGDETFRRYKIDENDDSSLPGREVKDILVDDDGTLWVATEGGLGQFLPSENAFKRYRYRYDDESTISNNNVICLEQGGDGLIRVGTRNGLNLFDPGRETFRRLYKDTPIRNFLCSNIIQTILVDPKGYTWVGTPAGLSSIAPDFSGATNYRQESNDINSLPNDHILSLMVDESGMIWIGTQSAGLATLNTEVPRFNSITYSGVRGFDPERNRVHGFADAEESLLWVATGNGVHQFDPGTGRSVFKSSARNHPMNETGYAALDIESSGDSMLWVATLENGLWQYRIAEDELIKHTVNSENPNGISANRINDVLIDSEGFVWAGTSDGGLNCYNPKVDKFKVYRYDGERSGSLRDNNVITLAEAHSGGIWLGTGNGGAYLLDPKKDEFIVHCHTRSKTHPIPGNTINCIYTDPEGIVWMGLGGDGLVKYNPAGESIEVFDTEEGMANDVILSITSDRFGVLWLSTNAGLSAFNTVTNTFRNYTEQAVLGRNVFLQGSVYRSKEGLIYFGGTNGFDFFNSVGIIKNDFVPETAIVGVKLLRKRGSDTLKTDFDLVGDTVILTRDFSGIALEFSSLSYRQPEKNRFAYRIQGIVDEWQYIGNRRYVSFSALDPGTYLFEVIGSNNDGVWSEEPDRLVLRVEAAFWEKAIFKVLVVMAFLLVVFLIYRYRINAEQERRKTLEVAVDQRTREIAKERDTNAMLLREIHHRVKNNLQVIVSLLNLQSIYIRDSKMIGVLSEIQNRIRSMSLIHQKMYKTKNLATINLAEYIEDLSRNLLDTYRIRQKVDLDVDVSVDKFNSDTLTPLGLFINEIISNSLKHAFKNDREGKITVKLHSVNNGRYLLEIGDNGVGLPDDIDEKDDTFGTELIGALSEQLNGELEVSSDSTGTRYRLEFEDVGESD